MEVCCDEIGKFVYKKAVMIRTSNCFNSFPVDLTILYTLFDLLFFKNQNVITYH